jgi:hypothetical protein
MAKKAQSSKTSGNSAHRKTAAKKGSSVVRTKAGRVIIKSPAKSSRTSMMSWSDAFKLKP